MEYFDECFKDAETISPSDLQTRKAKDVYNTLIADDFPHFNYLDCKQIPGKNEILFFEIEIDAGGQDRAYDILDTERVAVSFSKDDKNMPDIYALRKDFPFTPHRLWTEKGKPRQLCLSEEPYDELKLDWSPISFLHQIQNWLSGSAQGTLHKDDQALEQILFPSCIQLIIPASICNEREENFLSIHPINGENGSFSLIGKKLKSSICEEPRSKNTIPVIKHIAFSIKTEPQKHGMINELPITLEQLGKFLSESAEIDLAEKLKGKFMELKKSLPDDFDLNCVQFILLLFIPVKRYEESEIEMWTSYAFLVPKSVAELGNDFGAYGTHGGYTSVLALREITPVIPVDLPIVPLSVIFSLSKELASKYNGYSERISSKISAIGLGALGSQVFLNLIRSGLGEWTLIDDDVVLPHNLARHALVDGLGLSKAEQMSQMANRLFNDDPIAKPIVTNALNPGEKEAELLKAFEESDIILDMSTSIALARHLARDILSTARRISCFLNPDGTDSVLLSEGQNRKIPLDIIEMQYYRCLIHEPELEDHLGRDQKKFRYSNACRSVSTQIPQDIVALHSANCCRRFRKVIQEEEASITIFKTHRNALGIDCHIYKTQEPIEFKSGNWRIFTDEWFVEKISGLRKEKLPCETGGILIGAFDMERRIIYVVDTIPSPQGSVECPDSFIRGSSGKELEEIESKTSGKLRYIGEWHSHPDGCKPHPSSDDQNLLDWQGDFMKLESLPALMLILGDKDEPNFIIKEK